MIWIKFSLWLLLLYGFYYAVVIGWDYHRLRKPPAGSGDEELTFMADEDKAQTIPDAPSSGDIASAVIASGGVSIRQTFSLAREEAIEFTRAVSF
ncbi:hypothetical protein GCM10023149_50660 [Mucilaginibacter gynuensis]|uniref:Uncharacterized protein n=1 Tax=Mucilaginibacter gynuensis TaxID=1302236 RepID=A0ABP8HI94_9SPHI